MTPGMNPSEFFNNARKFRKEKLEEMGLQKKLNPKEILQNHLIRQPEVIKALSTRSENLEKRHTTLMNLMKDSKFYNYPLEHKPDVK